MRREVGLIVRDPRIASRLARIFETDWESARACDLPAGKLAKKVAKAIVKGIGPIQPVLEEIAGKKNAALPLNGGTIGDAVKEAVKTAVEDVVHDAVSQNAAERTGGRQ